MKNNIRNQFYSKTLKTFLDAIPNEKIDDEDLEKERQLIANTIKGNYSNEYNNSKTNNPKRSDKQTTQKNKTQKIRRLHNG